jgi:hypothetical protein
VKLNPDAFHLTPGMMTSASEIMIKKDKEEIVRACHAMKDDKLTELINDLNQIDEDPLNSRELKSLMHSRGLPLRYLGKICTNA